MTLFTDYGDRWGGGVVVYLVNRTKRSIEVDLQDDGRPFLRLEARDSGGAWRRAERHPYEWYMPGTIATPKPLKVGSMEFVRFLGWIPDHGEEGEIRYRLFEPGFISNAGKGIFDPEMIRLSRHDPMGMYYADIDLIREVLFDPEKVPGEWKESLLDIQEQARELFETIHFHHRQGEASAPSPSTSSNWRIANPTATLGGALREVPLTPSSVENFLNFI